MYMMLRNTLAFKMYRVYFLKRTQLFTVLMADLRQDINRFFPRLVVAFMEHFLEGIAPLRH